VQSHVVAKFAVRIAAVRDKLSGDPTAREEALLGLDAWLAEHIGVPPLQAIRFTDGEESRFEPLLWTVELPAGLTDPDELAERFTHELVHREQFFVMYRRLVPQAGDVDGLARLVNTVIGPVLQAAMRAGGMAVGSAVLRDAALWDQEVRDDRNVLAEARQAYAEWQQALSAGTAERTRAEATYAAAWLKYSAVSMEAVAFRAQAALRRALRTDIGAAARGGRAQDTDAPVAGWNEIRRPERRGPGSTPPASTNVELRPAMDWDMVAQADGTSPQCHRAPSCTASPTNADNGVP
jgi:hypothetical protein